MRRRFAPGIPISALLALAQACSQGLLERFEFGEPHMGTLMRVVLYARSPEDANVAAREAFAEIARLDRLLTDYDPESELSKLSARSGSGPVPVSEPLFAVLKAARHFSQISDGAFDVTVGPVVLLWREARKSRRLPDPEALSEALTRTGWRHMILDEVARTVSLEKSGMKLDLGGIGKGFAADRALAVLAARGVRSALVAAGGDLAIGEPPPDRSSWRIWIQDDRTIELVRSGVSTSGDTEQYLEAGGRRYSHIVDPRTGLGIENMTAVTVVAPDDTTADALTKVFTVLGPGRGLEFARTLPGIQVRMRWREGGATRFGHTPGFEKMFVQNGN